MFDGDRLYELRSDKGLTQDELGAIIFKSKHCVSRYERGTRQPDLDTVRLMADYFEVSVDYLLGRTRFPKVLERMLKHVLLDDMNDDDAAKVEEYAALLRGKRGKGK